MNKERNGKFIQVYTGGRFWPLDPKENEIHIEDIAHALSNQCRYSGHTEQFYSVAQHSLLVSWFCDQQYALEGLMHDASEAYLVDVPRPIKSSFPQYLEIEKSIMYAIGTKYNFRFPIHNEVTNVDNAMLWLEKEQVMKPGLDWYQDIKVEPIDAMRDYKIICMSPEEAKLSFLNRFNSLTEHKYA